MSLQAVPVHLSFTRSIGDIPAASAPSDRGAVRFAPHAHPTWTSYLPIPPTGPAVIDALLPPDRYDLRLTSFGSACSAIGCGSTILGNDVDLSTETSRAFVIDVVRAHFQRGTSGVQSPTLPTLLLGAGELPLSSDGDVDVIAGQYFVAARDLGRQAPCAPDRPAWTVCLPQIVGCN